MRGRACCGAWLVAGQGPGTPVLLNLLFALSVAPFPLLLLLPLLLHPLLLEPESLIQGFLPFFLLPQLFLLLQSPMPMHGCRP